MCCLVLIGVVLEARQAVHCINSCFALLYHSMEIEISAAAPVDEVPRSARRGAIPLIDVTAADIVEITNHLRTGSKYKRLKALIPILVW